MFRGHGVRRASDVHRDLVSLDLDDGDVFSLAASIAPGRSSDIVSPQHGIIPEKIQKCDDILHRLQMKNLDYP